MRLKVEVVDNSSRDEFCGWLDDTLKIKVRAVPESGKATQAILKLLADKQGIGRDQLILLSDNSQPRKVIQISEVDERHIMELLK